MTAPHNLIGQTLDQYRIEEQIGTIYSLHQLPLAPPPDDLPPPNELLLLEE